MFSNKTERNATGVYFVLTLALLTAGKVFSDYGAIDVVVLMAGFVLAWDNRMNLPCLDFWNTKAIAIFWIMLSIVSFLLDGSVICGAVRLVIIGLVLGAAFWAIKNRQKIWTEITT